MVAVLLVQAIFIFFFGTVGSVEGEGLFSTMTLVKMAKVAITAIVLLIVCVPEGLALAC